MVWYIKALEISRDGQATGKFRLTARSDEDGGGPYGLCDHDHSTEHEACLCLEAQEKSQIYTGITFRKGRTDQQRIVDLIQWVNSPAFMSVKDNLSMRQAILKNLK